MRWWGLPHPICPDGEQRRESNGLLCCHHRQLIDKVVDEGGWAELRNALLHPKTVPAGTPVSSDFVAPTLSSLEAAKWVKDHPALPSKWLLDTHPYPQGKRGATPSVHPEKLTGHKGLDWDCDITLFDRKGAFGTTTLACANPACSFCGGMSDQNYWSWTLQAWVSKSAYAELDQAFQLSRPLQTKTLKEGLYSANLTHGVQRVDPGVGEVIWIPEYDLWESKIGPESPANKGTGNHIYPYYIFDPFKIALVKMGNDAPGKWKKLQWFVVNWHQGDWKGIMKQAMPTFNAEWVVDMMGD